MSRLFETTTLNGMKLANRFVRSATWEGMATVDGVCKPELKDLYVRLAQGGVGLIITSHTYVRPDGMGSPRQLGLSDDRFVPVLRQVTDAIHQHGGRVAVQPLSTSAPIITVDRSKTGPEPYWKRKTKEKMKP